MKRSRLSVLRQLQDFCRNRSGSMAVAFGVMIPAIAAVGGLSVDVGRTYVAKRSLDSHTQAAAMAGAYKLQTTTDSATVTAAVNTWTSANPASGVTVTASTPTTTCVTATSNLPACGTSNPNAVSVTQTATVSTYFLKVVGRSSFTVSSTATAAKAGGDNKAMNVMFVIDATGSMDTSDSNCTVPGVSGSPSRFQCALYSIQSVLKTMPTSLDSVGLMVFPGLASQYSPASGCTSSGQPSTVPYYTATIKYRIGTTLDATYNDGAQNLNTSSPIVRAVGKYASVGKVNPCIKVVGGQGSHAAEVISAAQTALGTPPANTQNVIIFLSDGDVASTLTNLNGQSDKLNSQCQQAVTAAAAATTAGTRVYSVAYGASSSSGCSRGSNNPSKGSGDTMYPCATMKAIASDSSKFYTTSTSCQNANSANTYTNLPLAFQAITGTLSKPRLVTN